MPAAEANANAKQSHRACVLCAPSDSSLTTMVGPRRLPRPTRPLQAGAIEATLAANRQPDFSTSQRNSGPIGQFHKPPNELPADFDNVLRPHRQTPWKLKRAAHFTPPVPRSTRANLRTSVWPEFVRIAVIHAIKRGKIQPRRSQSERQTAPTCCLENTHWASSMDEKQKPRALARGFRKT